MGDSESSDNQLLNGLDQGGENSFPVNASASSSVNHWEVIMLLGIGTTHNIHKGSSKKIK